MTQASTDLTCKIVRDRKIHNHHITTANLQRKFTGDHCKALLIVGDSPFLSFLVVSTAVSRIGGTVKSFAILSVFVKN